VYGYSRDEASIKVAAANNALTEAFTEVAQAEKAQANVTDLTLKLNEAGTELAKADNAFRVGYYDNAIIQAHRCVDLVQGVIVEAQSLKADAEIARRNQLMLTAAFSSIGLVALLGVGLFGWRYLRNRFVREAMKMKPEVVPA
jgi:type VI protein secretion system component VasK